MAGLVPAIHVFLSETPEVKTWMPGTRPGMTKQDCEPVRVEDMLHRLAAMPLRSSSPGFSTHVADGGSEAVQPCEA